MVTAGKSFGERRCLSERPPHFLGNLGSISEKSHFGTRTDLLTAYGYSSGTQDFLLSSPAIVYFENIFLL